MEPRLDQYLDAQQLGSFSSGACTNYFQRFIASKRCAISGIAELMNVLLNQVPHSTVSTLFFLSSSVGREYSFPKQFTVFVSLLVSAHFHWPCSISIHLSPRSVTAGVRPFPLAMQHFYSCVSQVCHWWCPPFSAGHAAFLFICLPGLSLLVSALFRPFLLAM